MKSAFSAKGDGSVVELSLSDGTPGTLVSGPTRPMNPTCIAVDTDNVHRFDYSSGGTVMPAPK